MNKSFERVFKPLSESFQDTLVPCVGWLLFMLLSIQASNLAAQDDPRLAASVEMASSLQQQLGARLKAAIAEGGPVRAIEVCQVEAPRIAAELSDSDRHVSVGRTSLKVRNPDNAPDAEELRILQKFSQALADGGQNPQSEFVTYPNGSARYMQSINTQAVCLVCHGKSLSQEVAVELAERYPNDQATGYSEGELRGAFVVNWPAER